MLFLALNTWHETLIYIIVFYVGYLLTYKWLNAAGDRNTADESNVWVKQPWQCLLHCPLWWTPAGPRQGPKVRVIVQTRGEFFCSVIIRKIWCLQASTLKSSLLVDVVNGEAKTQHFHNMAGTTLLTTEATPSFFTYAFGRHYANICTEWRTSERENSIEVWSDTCTNSYITD